MDFSNLWQHCYRCTHAYFHTVQKRYEAYRYQQCHGLTALPAKMSVFNSHMQGSHSMISNKPDCTPKTTYSYNKNQKACVTNKNIWVCLFELNDKSRNWFDYSFSIEFFCSANIHIWTTFLLLKTFFIMLVHTPLMISH